MRDQGSRRLIAFRTLSSNGQLVRVLTGYALFMVTELAVWIAMLVYAYGRGGATLAGLIAVAQLVPAAIAAKVPAAAYVAAVVASTAVATTRPAQAAVVSAVSVSADPLPDDSTSENESSLREALRLVVFRPGLRLMVTLLTAAVLAAS